MLDGRSRAHAWLAPLVAILAGCAATTPDATVTSRSAEATGLERRAIPPSGVHVVAPGQTLSEIAWIYRLDTNALARANGILDPDHVVAGRRLALRWEAPPDVGAPPRRAERPAETPVATAETAPSPLRVVVTPRD